jgi:dTDP-4-amino-4,6-dideoxygalactose transaminase
MSRRIPISAPKLGLNEYLAVQKVMKSGILGSSNQVAQFEKNFASKCETTHCVAVNSGTSALHLGLLSLGVGPGDDVIVPSFTFAATANAVLLTGANVVFADIDPTTFNLDPVNLEHLITDRCKAIIPVHLFGLPADMDPIKQIANKFGLVILEDAAQAHGATYKGKMTGNLGDVAAFSFYATKNITTGEGGAITTNLQDVCDFSRLLRNQGMKRIYENEVAGYNNRMTEIQAAMGIIQLKKLSDFNEQRRKNAAFYNSALEGVVLPIEPLGSRHVYHQYTISIPDLSKRMDVVS